MNTLSTLSRFAATLALLGAFALPVRAATVTLVAGNGFSDTTPRSPEGGNNGTTLGQQRTNLFNAAAQVWGAALTSSQTIKVQAAFETLACQAATGTLGSAGATGNYILTDGVDDRYYAVALAEALTGQNLNAAASNTNEISATFNARVDLDDTGCLGNTRFYYGLTGPTPAGTIALYPVVLHELGHGLGFAAFLCRTSPQCTNTSPPTPYGAYFFNVVDIWSDTIRDNNIDGLGTNRRWSELTTAERVVSFTHDPFLVWNGMTVSSNIAGQAAVAKNEDRLRMYAPGTFVPGSSISHFHSDASPNLLMEPSLSTGVFTQTDLTDCLFADIGWLNSRCATVINAPPTLDALASPVNLLEDAATQVVNLSGIGDNDALVQELSVAAVSSNTALIPNPTITYTNPNSTGSISYTPQPNQSGSAVITVGVFDDGGWANGGNDLVTRQFTVNVTAVNDAPVFSSGVPTTATEAVAYTYAPAATDVDGPGQAWSLVSPTHTCGGSINASSGAFAFTPASPVPPASCVVALQVCDGGTPNQCASQSASVSISAVNNAPVIGSTAPTTATEDVAYSYSATRNDPDGPGQSWTLVAPTHTCGGSIDASSGAFTFTPAGPVPIASCVVAVQVCDGGTPNQCTTQNTTVTIAAVNDAPVISSSAATAATEDVVYSYNATRDDPDGPGQSWSLVSPAHTCGGSVIAATGAFAFTPAGPTPPPSCVVALQVCDGASPNLCVTQTTTVTIAAVNDAPTISSSVPTTATEDSVYSYNPTRNDADGPGQSWSLLSPTHTCGGGIDSSTGAFAFTPVGPTPAASCVVALQLCDGATPNLCVTQTATVTIAAVNDAPVISSSAATSATEDLAYSYNATRNDPDGPAQNWSLVAPTHTCGGSIGAASGAFSFTPAGPTPPASCVVAVQVCDGASPSLCATQTTTVSIAAVNDAPTISSVAPALAVEDALYSYNTSRNDPDGPGQNWSLSAAHTCGGSIVPASGLFTFTPAGPVPAAGCVVSVEVCDGGTPNLCSGPQTTSITIMPINDAPLATAPANVGSNEDTVRNFSGSDRLGLADADSASVQIALSVDNGSLSLASVAGLSFVDGDGSNDASMRFNATPAAADAAVATLSFRPTADYNGNATLNFSVDDGAAAVVQRSVAIAIAAQADIVDDAVSLLEDGSLVFNVISGTQGASPDTFAGTPVLSAIGSASHGSATFAADGSVSYTPAANFSGTDTFGYTVSSGGVSESGNITVTITAVNDPPTLNTIPDPALIGVDAGLQTIGLGGIGPGGGETTQTLTVSAVSSNPTLIPHPSVSYTSPNASGTLTFAPQPGQHGTAIITVTVSDGGGTANGGIASVSRSFTQVVGVLDRIFANGFQSP